MPHIPIRTPPDSFVITSPKPLPSNLPNNGSERNVIFYTNSGYLPSTITTKKGQTVMWKNQSSSGMWTASGMHPIHKVYPDTDIALCGTQTLVPMFDSCINIASGQNWSFRFNNVGSWKYHNHLQPNHTGIIIVE